MSDITFKSIGTIHTPYKEGGFAPSQPLEREDAVATIKVLPEYEPCLADLASFSHIIVIFNLHKSHKNWKPKVKPPWAKGEEVSLFATRSPNRPNPIGLSIVKIKSIEGSTINVSGLDAYDGTPVLDIKPYIKDLDSKEDANNGWIDKMDGHQHILDHLRGIPHDHSHDHEHEHKHEHGHHHHKHDHGDE
jgi:tRNA (adenine37-N6)-methyltransferase